MSAPSVLILYNHVGEDEFEQLRQVDPATLGFKPEYDIHVATVREEIDAIALALQREGFRAKVVNINDDVRRLERLLKYRPPDVVFNLVELLYDNPRLEGMIAGLYEIHRVAYTGAPPFALGLCQRKGLTKQVLLANGVPTPHYRLCREASIPRRHGLRYPLIVKPAREDASAGVDEGSVVYDYPSLVARLEKVFMEFRAPIIVEEFIEGRELHVSVLGNDPAIALPILEFDFSELPQDHPAIISYDAKWNPLNEAFHRVHTVCPAPLPTRVRKRVEDAALRAHRVTGVRDYSRIDIRLSPKNQVFVLEVNPNPDLTEGVSFMESAEKAGMSFQKTLRAIVEFALARKT
jgi:D-alanine-D-alanine ligase